ncbi:putative FAD-binding domain, FAD/NAD(P)-binding domain superfamily [Dioscorea sansibarensis]
MDQENKFEDEKDMIHEVVIVGAGIGGLAAALALKRVGIKSLVLERSSELRAFGTALHIFQNGWRALEVLGVAAKLDKTYNDFLTNMASVSNTETGSRQYVSSSGGGADRCFSSVTLRIRPIHRKFLLETLAEELPLESIKFLCKLLKIKTEVLKDSSTIYVLYLEDGSVIKAKAVIGCEGVNSVVAQWLGLRAPISSGRAAVRGVGLYPQGHDFKKEHQQFVGNGVKAGFIPISNTEIYWYLNKASTPQDQEVARVPEKIISEVMEITKEFPLEYKQVVSHTDLSTLTIAPLLFRVPWDIVYGPSHRGCVTVTGDAFHPMTPDIAQGGCCALEDAVVLARNITNMRHNVSHGIEMYVKERRWRAARLVAGSYIAGVLGHCKASGMLGSVMESFRNYVFNWILHSKYGSLNYDCGTLPVAADI